MLGLLELTKLMSESGTEISPYDLSYIPLLVNGDLKESVVPSFDLRGASCDLWGGASKDLL